MKRTTTPEALYTITVSGGMSCDLEPGKEGKGGFHTSTVSINVPFQLFPSQPFYHASIIKEAQMIKCSVLSDTAALEVIHSRSQFIHIRPISKR